MHLDATPNLGAFARKLQRRTADPIAVVGTGCRFPGGADPQTFADTLAAGRCVVGEVPQDRWDIDRWYSSVPGAPGKMSTRRGAFVDGVDRFDAAAFGISPREAARMDPQHRMLLEVAWETLDAAAVPRRALEGSRTGVFVGMSTVDYAFRFDDAAMDGYHGTGLAFSAAAGRVSAFFDWRGPSEVIDTACSSSLVAVHRACEALRNREADAALAGGVNLMLRPAASIAFSQAGMLARDGLCKTFDARADGYVRGEGCGLVLLKRLSDALADGDPILAVLTGSAVNHNGRGTGLTAPSGPAQEALIRRALAQAGREPERVDYVEAHGTGTALGDPQELYALGQVLGERADRATRKVWVGAVKTNVGHLEPASGIAGLIKVIAMLGRGEIFPHLHLEQVNPEVDLDGPGFAIPTTSLPWPSRDGTRVAGVSSFGFSGTNAHVVVEQAPEPQARPTPAPGRRVWTGSARTERALRALAERWLAHLARTDDSLADLCHTSNVGRDAFAHRAAVVASTLDELRVGLAALADGRAAASVFTATTPAPSEPLEAAAAAWARGAVDDPPASEGRRVVTPATPFDRERHWVEPPADRATGGGPLVGRRVAAASAAAVFERSIGTGDPAYLSGHRIYGLPLFPATGFVAQLVDAARAVHGDVALLLDDVRFERALVLPDREGIRVQVVVGTDRTTAEVHSQSGGVDAPWTRHARAAVRPLPADDAPPFADVGAALAAGFESVEVDAHYRSLADRGMGYDGPFRSVRELARGPLRSGDAIGRVDHPPGPLTAHVHPATLDACLQVVATAVATRFAGASRMAYLPVAMRQVRVRAPLAGVASCRARVTGSEGFDYTAQVVVFDASGAPAIEIDGLEMRGFDRVHLREGGDPGRGEDLLRRLAETPVDRHHELLVDLVRREAAAVIGVEPGSIGVDLMLFELGMSSLGSVELLYRLQKDLRCELSGIVPDYETVNTLADAVHARIGQGGSR